MVKVGSSIGAGLVIDILYCGVCHSDIHQVRDEWGGIAKSE
jgi:D-arabinose 1-dehydrogenase-like Zn-dependent alcohol dehydrogenase